MARIQGGSEMNEQHWCVSENEERFSADRGTRNEAIAFAIKEFDGRKFYLAKCCMADRRTFYPDMDELVEGMVDRAHDGFGDFAEDWEPKLSPEAAEEIYAILDKHVEKPTFWHVWDVECIEIPFDKVTI